LFAVTLNKDDLMKGMLHPFRQRLTDYVEKPFVLKLANGRQESGTEYSGTMPGFGKLTGFVVTIQVKNGIYSLSTTDRQEFYSTTSEHLKILARSIKIGKLRRLYPQSFPMVSLSLVPHNSRPIWTTLDLIDSQKLPPFQPASSV